MILAINRTGSPWDNAMTRIRIQKGPTVKTLSTKPRLVYLPAIWNTFPIRVSHTSSNFKLRFCNTLKNNRPRYVLKTLKKSTTHLSFGIEEEETDKIIPGVN